MVVQFPSYVNNPHCRLYDLRRSTVKKYDVLKIEDMVSLLDWVGVAVKQVAEEFRLPLGEDKTERLVL